MFVETAMSLVAANDAPLEVTHSEIVRASRSLYTSAASS